MLGIPPPTTKARQSFRSDDGDRGCSNDCTFVAEDTTPDSTCDTNLSQDGSPPKAVERLRRVPSPTKRYMQDSRMYPVVVLNRTEAALPVNGADSITGTWIDQNDRVPYMNAFLEVSDNEMDEETDKESGVENVRDTSSSDE